MGGCLGCFESTQVWMGIPLATLAWPPAILGVIAKIPSLQDDTEGLSVDFPCLWLRGTG